jgi:hypothetical protein
MAIETDAAAAAAAAAAVATATDRVPSNSPLGYRSIMPTLSMDELKLLILCTFIIQENFQRSTGFVHSKKQTSQTDDR